MRYVCGWDGGGTKTAVCALDLEGNALGESGFGPLNPNGAEPGRVRESIRGALQWMRSLPGGQEGCGMLTIGMAGFSNQESVSFVRKAVQQAGYTGPLGIVGDQEIALNGAIDGCGAVLIAGTGSVCCGRNERGEIFRAGGCGYLIDDPGSGYAIGRDILAAAVRAHDGRGPATCLTEALYETLGVHDMPQLITWLYSPTTGKRDIAALAPLLSRGLDAADEAAEQILERAVAELTDMAAAVWSRMGLTHGEMAMIGGVTREKRLRSRLTAALQACLPGADVHPPLRTPVQGAAMMALRALS